MRYHDNTRALTAYDAEMAGQSVVKYLTISIFILHFWRAVHCASAVLYRVKAKENDSDDFLILLLSWYSIEH